MEGASLVQYLKNKNKTRTIAVTTVLINEGMKIKIPF